MPGKILTTLLLLFVFSCSKKPESSSRDKIYSKGDIEIKMTSSKQSLRTCDLLELTIEITYPRNLTVKLPGKESNYGSFSVYQIEPGAPSSINEQFNKIHHIIILEPGLPGDHKLPPLTFEFYTENGVKQTILTDKESFNVETVLTDNQQQIEDIIIQETKRNYWLPIIAFLLIICPIIYLASLKRSRLLTVEEKIEAKYLKFNELQNKQPAEILSQLPPTICNFLKEKFSKPELPDNVDVIIRELDSRLSDEQSKNLKETFSDYEKVRYSKDKSFSALTIWKQFDSILKQLKGDVV